MREPVRRLPHSESMNKTSPLEVVFREGIRPGDTLVGKQFFGVG
jgi:hypothetical protein